MNDALALKWVLINIAISAVVLLCINLIEKPYGRRSK